MKKLLSLSLVFVLLFFISLRVFGTDIFDQFKILDSNTITEYINDGGDVNVRNKDGDTVLIFAVENGARLDSIKCIINAKADVNAKNNYGYTALTSAAGLLGDHTDIVKLLIDAKADVNAKDNNGYTALMMASHFDNINIVKLLIDAKADVNAKDNNGNTVLMYAMSKSAKILKKAGAKNISRNIFEAAQSGDTGFIINYIKNGGNVNLKDQDGKTALIYAVEKKDDNIVKLLIDAKADVNVRSHGWTVLMDAQGSTNIMNMLIDAGADVNARNNDFGNILFGKTALMIALRDNDVNSAQLLVDSNHKRPNKLPQLVFLIKTCSTPLFILICFIIFSLVFIIILRLFFHKFKIKYLIIYLAIFTVIFFSSLYLVNNYFSSTFEPLYVWQKVYLKNFNDITYKNPYIETKVCRIYGKAISLNKENSSIGYDYLPQYVCAKSTNEVETIIIFDRRYDKECTYESGGIGYRGIISLEVINLKKKTHFGTTFEGDPPPYQKNHSGDWHGNFPDSEVIKLLKKTCHKSS